MKLKKIMAIALMSAISASAQAATSSVTIDGDHGKLSALVTTPEGKSSYPMVIICHGFTANKESVLLESLSEKLEKLGIGSVRFDFNGHGHSEGKFEDMTVLNEISDAKKVYEYVKGHKEVSSVSLAGHSQGGVVASMLAGELGYDRIKSVVLMAPAAVLRDDAIRGQLFDIRYDSINPPKSVSLHHPEHPDYSIGRMYIKTAQTLPIFETAGKYEGPVMMIHGMHDIVVPYTYSERYHETFKNSELKLMQSADHSFTSQYDEATTLAADFFDKHIKR